MVEGQQAEADRKSDERDAPGERDTSGSGAIHRGQLGRIDSGSAGLSHQIGVELKDGLGAVNALGAAPDRSGGSDGARGRLHRGRDETQQQQEGERNGQS